MPGIGLIGCGHWGSNWARTLATLPGAELRWCCDVNPEALGRVARQFPQVRTTADLGQVLADPQVEGVVIATGAPRHFEQASRVLKAGKHVLVEKPLTLNHADAVALHQLAERQRRVLLVGHLLEYHPAILYLKELIDGGELGEICYLYSQRLNLGRVRSDENAWWSLAVHDVSVALRLFDCPPVSVTCRGQCVLQPQIADVVFATLEFPQGRLAHIHVSWLDPHKTRKPTVVGSKMAVFDDTRPAGKVTVHDQGCDVTGERLVLRQGAMTTPPIDLTEPLLREAAHFLDCIAGRARPLSDGLSGAAVVAILERGQQSLETGRTVPL